MAFNFWSSPLIKNFEEGKLPVIETEINLSKSTIIALSVMIVVVVLTIIVSKKIS